MAEIVWLASYPKSGNTWFRIFLANLRQARTEPVDLNAVPYSMASYRPLLDRASGVETADLTAEEVAWVRPRAYAAYATHAPRFLKTHDAYRTPAGETVYAAPATGRVVYFVRNPLDVCVSYAHHLGRSIPYTLRTLADEQHRMASGRYLWHHLPQYLGSWSSHVTGWAETADLPVHVVRYEDMKHAPLATFAAAARFAGVDATPEAVEQALALSRFERLQQQEQAAGFRERPMISTAFFRKGQVGSWREALTPAQVDHLIEHHGTVMQRYGYLHADGTLTPDCG